MRKTLLNSFVSVLALSGVLGTSSLSFAAGSVKIEEEMGKSLIITRTPQVANDPRLDQNIEIGGVPLPRNVFKLVISFLPVEDQITARKVSFLWKSLCDEFLCFKDTFLHPAIQQTEDGLYVAQISSKNLFLVMERIDSSNVELWQKYAEVQSDDRISTSASVLDKSLVKHKGSTSGGSCHFKKVLQTIDYKENEVWVAYVSRNPKPQKIPSEMSSYSSLVCPDFAKDIEMFVTVTTSPRALLTSHMGITFSFEHAKDRTKGVSLDLHSFAAKVMLQRNPMRRFMINAPVFAMEKIMVQALPRAVYVGTHEMLSESKERLSRSYQEFRERFFAESFDKKSASIPWPREIREKVDKICKTANHEISQIFEQESQTETRESSEQTRQMRMKKHLERMTDNFNMTDSFNGISALEIRGQKFVIVPEKLESYIEGVSRLAFEESRRPQWIKGDSILFGHPRDPSGLYTEVESLEKFVQYIQQFPPVLSVDTVWLADKTINIFTPGNPNKPWLTVHKGDSKYRWMFERAFSPAGDTHFIAVDLVSLANARAGDRLSNSQHDLSKNRKE